MFLKSLNVCGDNVVVAACCTGVAVGAGGATAGDRLSAAVLW